jgi:membrane-associated protease RseP (regulator of RpoE activity)
VITAVNRTTVTTWDQVNDFAIKNPGLLNLTVKRGGNTVDVTISPAMVTRPVVDAAGNPSNQTVPFFGVVLKPVRVPQSIATSLQYSGSMLGSTFEMIATLPVQVYKMISGTISGEKRDGNGPISVIGIGQVAGEVASNQQASWLDKLSTGLMMLASLNFALFAFNMIPLLPLDGGHIAGGLYEAIKRGLWRITGRKDPGPADTAQLMPITYLVTYALIALSLVLIVVDLINPIVLK